jgi:hypothetical protein
MNRDDEILVALIDDALMPPGQDLAGQMRMIAIESGGRPADAIGVSPASWNKWLSSAKGLGGAAPSQKSRIKIANGIRAIVARSRSGKGASSQVSVRADIEWAGYRNRKPIRTTTLDGLDLDRMFAAYGRGDMQGVADAFHDATFERYGAEVNFHEAEALDI